LKPGLYILVSNPHSVCLTRSPDWRRELLKTAKFATDGELNEATIPWLKSRRAKDSSLDAALMGYIHIRGRKLIVKVNSAQRAKAFGQLISDIPAATARHRRTRKHPTEKRVLFPSDAPNRHITRH